MKKLLFLIFIVISSKSYLIAQSSDCFVSNTEINVIINTRSDGYKKDVAKNVFNSTNCYFTVSQIEKIGKSFFSDGYLTEFLKLALTHTIDDEKNFLSLANLIKSDGYKSELVSYVLKNKNTQPHSIQTNNSFQPIDNQIKDNLAPEITIISQQFKSIDNGKNIKMIGISGNVKDASGVKELLVNNERVKILSTGNFVHVVSMNFADSIIVIKATDFKDNSITKYFSVSLSISDVDVNIPSNSLNYANRFALIIGNEDYSSYQTGLNKETNVDFAANDATIFYEYAIKILGIPKENILLLTNAKYIEMNKAIQKLALKAKYLGTRAELLFYYSGHGTPDVNSKDSYLLPVDCNSSDLGYAVRLDSLYSKLTNYPSKKVTCFIDACFSGGLRNGNYRGVKIKAKNYMIQGNLVVFTACSNDQLALAYPDKQHGLFTYFLLKKMQETKGNITYSKLFDFLFENVGGSSGWINENEQTPSIISSPTLNDAWKSWKLNE